MEHHNGNQTQQYCAGTGYNQEMAPLVPTANEPPQPPPLRIRPSRRQKYACQSCRQKRIRCDREFEDANCRECIRKKILCVEHVRPARNHQPRPSSSDEVSRGRSDVTRERSGSRDQMTNQNAGLYGFQERLYTTLIAIEELRTLSGRLNSVGYQNIESAQHTLEQLYLSLQLPSPLLPPALSPSSLYPPPLPLLNHAHDYSAGIRNELPVQNWASTSTDHSQNQPQNQNGSHPQEFTEEEEADLDPSLNQNYGYNYNQAPQ